MNCSEGITIMVLFHSGGLQKHEAVSSILCPEAYGRHASRNASYNRLVELIPRVTLPMAISLGLLYEEGYGDFLCRIDPHQGVQEHKNKRIKRNRVFNDLAQVGRSAMGYFSGFKLHIIINDKGSYLTLCPLVMLTTNSP